MAADIAVPLCTPGGSSTLPLPAPCAARNLFSTVVGFLLVYYPFGSHVVHGVVTSLVTYVLMWQIPRKCGTLTWLLVFPYLTVL